jgi:hypothetical protein
MAVILARARCVPRGDALRAAWRARASAGPLVNGSPLRPRFQVDQAGTGFKNTE